VIERIGRQTAKRIAMKNDATRSVVNVVFLKPQKLGGIQENRLAFGKQKTIRELDDRIARTEFE
jgi:hypothetical protein